MKIERRFTSPNEDAYSSIEFTKTTSEIRNPDGTVVFHLADLEVPASWSQVASDVLAQKYFRKAGVPSDTKAVKESGVPSFLRRRVATENATVGGETSAKQVFDRLAGAWAYWGWKGGYFTTEEDASAYLTRCAICWQHNAPPRTRRNGLTQGFIGLMALMARHRGITMSITKRAS